MAFELDQRRTAQARSQVMFWSSDLAYNLWKHLRRILSISIVPLLLSVCPLRLTAQSFERELNNVGKGLLIIRNRNGRVTVIASNDEKSKVSFKAISSGAPLKLSDVAVSGNEISVRERPKADRIDLVVQVPARARVKIESETGMVDVIGSVEVA